MKNNTIFILLFIFLLFIVDNSFADQYVKYYHQAVSLAKTGQVVEGERLLSNIIAKRRKIAELYMWRGRYKVKYTHKYSSAIIDFNISEKMLSSPRVEVYWFRADSYYNLRMYNQAIVDYTKAIRMQPKRAKMYYFRAKAYAKIGMVNEARNDLKNCVRWAPKYKPKAEALYMKILKGNLNF